MHRIFKKWFPWHFLIRRITGYYGFVDPITLMARLRQFGKPSKVQEPIELLRAGLIFHARGLVTPLFDAWSIDVWLMSEAGNLLVPSRQVHADQTLDLTDELAVTTTIAKDTLSLVCTATVAMDSHSGPVMQMRAKGGMQKHAGWLIVSIRPYNPEGIHFIDHIRYKDSRFTINHTHDVHFTTAPEKVLFSTYDHGDVALDLNRPQAENQASCPIGMATAAAFFPIRADETTHIDIQVPLEKDTATTSPDTGRGVTPTSAVTAQTAALSVPDADFQFLYDAAVRTLLLLSADEVYTGSCSAPANPRQPTFSLP